MSVTNHPNGISSYGMPVVPFNLPVTKHSKHYWLDPVNGNDANDGFSPETAVKTIEEGEDRLTANQHDALFYISGSSSPAGLSATLTWDKNYTHFIGLAAPTPAATRARIFQLSTATGVSPLVNVTATGCIFSGLYAFQGVADATSLVCWQITGGRNLFHNCHFFGMGHNDIADDAGGRSLKLSGAEENYFLNCTIGGDTIARSAANAEIECASQATRNKFEDCLILSHADSADHLWVDAAANGDVDRFVWFKKCTFMNYPTNFITAAATMTVGMSVATGLGGMIVLDHSAMFGATDWADNFNRVVQIGIPSDESDHSASMGIGIVPN